MGTINVIVAVVAVRMILMVATMGSIYLSWFALSQPDPYRLAGLAVYAIVVVAPLIWLAGPHK